MLTVAYGGLPSRRRLIAGTTGNIITTAAVNVAINTGVRTESVTVIADASVTKENILPIYANAYPTLSARNITKPIITIIIV